MIGGIKLGVADSRMGLEGQGLGSSYCQDFCDFLIGQDSMDDAGRVCVTEWSVVATRP
jgi:hypothetical protein